MRLSTFIRDHEHEIVERRKTFARTLVPASDDMSPHALRNHIKDILAFISGDIDAAQSKSEQVDKSEGKKPKRPDHSAAEIHAMLRQAGGFNMDQMVSEFRSLRASVTRLWEARHLVGKGRHHFYRSLPPLAVTQSEEAIDLKKCSAC